MVEPFNVWYDKLHPTPSQVFTPHPEQTTPNKFSLAIVAINSLDKAVELGKIDGCQYRAIIRELIEAVYAEPSPIEEIPLVGGATPYEERNNHE